MGIILHGEIFLVIYEYHYESLWINQWYSMIIYRIKRKWGLSVQ